MSFFGEYDVLASDCSAERTRAMRKLLDRAERRKRYEEAESGFRMRVVSSGSRVYRAGDETRLEVWQEIEPTAEAVGEDERRRMQERFVGDGATLREVGRG